jgi:transposase
MNPPRHAVVVSIDEKSQIQALDRTQPGLPLKRGKYAVHKHPQVLAWLAEHPRWTFHFTPTSCSWLNAVEGFFSKLTRQSLKRGVFRSVDDLESAITRYIAATNRNPKPFV